jgi:hypothetical protein
MVLVAEGHRLIDHYVDLGHIRRTDHHCSDRDDSSYDEDGPKDRHLGDRVHTGVKNLGHPRAFIASDDKPQRDTHVTLSESGDGTLARIEGKTARHVPAPASSATTSPPHGTL